MSSHISENNTDIPDITLEELASTHDRMFFDFFSPIEEHYKWLQQQSIAKKVYFVICNTVLKVYISNVRPTKMYIDFSEADFANYCEYPSRFGTKEYPMYEGYRRVMLGYSLVEQLGIFYIPK